MLLMLLPRRYYAATLMLKMMLIALFARLHALRFIFAIFYGFLMICFRLSRRR